MIASSKVASLASFLTSVKSVYQEQATIQAGEIASIADNWLQHGLRPGDIVLIALPNGTDLLKHWAGVLVAGGVPALVSPATPSLQLGEILSRFAARAIISANAGFKRNKAAELFTLSGVHVVMFGPSEEPGASSGEVIILTSGTSGFASGCVFTLDALMLNAARHADAIGLRENDIVLVNLPLHYSYALVAQVLAAWIKGAGLLISGPPFHIPSYLTQLAEGQVTVSSLTPVLVRKLLQHKHTLPDTLRVVTVGGDMLAPQHVEELLHLHPGRELYLTYGLTEAGPRVSTLAAHNEPTHRFASAGLPLQGTRVRLDDASSPYGPGELLVSSETVMKRRIGFVEEGGRKDWRDQGFLATGDIFELDEHGYLFFRGRLADFLVKDGEKVCLASVRRIATSFHGVVAVRTLPFVEAKGKTGFDLTLSVAETSEVSQRDLQTQIRRALRPVERPRHINIIPMYEKSLALHK